MKASKMIDNPETLGYSTVSHGSKWCIEDGYVRERGLADSVVILAADGNYIQHAKALFVNCRMRGQWEKDFALVTTKGTDVSDFSRRGIHILESESTDGFYQKLSVFSPFFRKWNYAMYMDCDIIVQDTLAPILAEIEDCSLLGDIEPFDLFHMFTYWATMETYNNAPEGIYRWLWTNFDPRYIQYNTAIMPFRPWGIPVDAVDRLTAMERKIHPINIHVVRGTDQAVINLAFYRQFTSIRNKLFSYWQHEGPESRVLHYCSGYAPWIEKKPGMDAYGNPRFQLPCYDIYKANLSRWEEVFPLC